MGNAAKGGHGIRILVLIIGVLTALLTELLSNVDGAAKSSASLGFGEYIRQVRC